MLQQLLELTKGHGPDAVIDAVGMESMGSETTMQRVTAAVQSTISATDRSYALNDAILSCRPGGIVSVPLLQKLCRLPLRQCIATTAACMCFSAAFGAVSKNMALQGLGLDWRDSLQIAAILAPTAVLGGLFGGRLAHILPLTTVRVAFILLLLWSSAEMSMSLESAWSDSV